MSLNTIYKQIHIICIAHLPRVIIGVGETIVPLKDDLKADGKCVGRGAILDKEYGILYSFSI